MARDVYYAVPTTIASQWLSAKHIRTATLNVNLYVLHMSLYLWTVTMTTMVIVVQKQQVNPHTSLPCLMQLTHVDRPMVVTRTE